MKAILGVFISIALLTCLLATPASSTYPHPKPTSFTFYGVVNPNSTTDYTISWPWSAGMSNYNAVCGGTCAGAGQIGAGESPNPLTECFYITRVFTWNNTGSPIMVGKLDVNGYGGDYLTPGQLLGVGDSGWYPENSRPLFKPGDELHIHTTTPGTVALATIFYIKTNC